MDLKGEMPLFVPSLPSPLRYMFRVQICAIAVEGFREISKLLMRNAFGLAAGGLPVFTYNTSITDVFQTRRLSSGFQIILCWIGGRQGGVPLEIFKA